jgi:hypothetical protein
MVIVQVICFFLNGMSSIGHLGRVFETARSALPGEAPPKKNSSKKILKNKNH